MHHPDFRINGKIFATVKRDELSGMVALTPEQQREFIDEDPRTFASESGAWGRSGYTRVLFDSAEEDTVGRALTLARQNVLNKSSGKKAKK
jgi:hypothetical protein